MAHKSTWLKRISENQRSCAPVGFYYAKNKPFLAGWLQRASVSALRKSECKMESKICRFLLHVRCSCDWGGVQFDRKVKLFSLFFVKVQRTVPAQCMLIKSKTGTKSGYSNCTFTNYATILTTNEYFRTSQHCLNIKLNQQYPENLFWQTLPIVNSSWRMFWGHDFSYNVTVRIYNKGKV